MSLSDQQIAWMQRTRSLSGGAASAGLLGGPPQLTYVLPPSEIAGCAKYLDQHNFAVVLIDGKTGLTASDYEIRLDNKTQGLFDVVELLLRQIPEGALPNGPIRATAQAQIAPLVEDRFQSALNKAMAERNRSAQPAPATTASGTAPDPAGKSTMMPINPPPPTKHDDDEAEKLYELDLDVARTLRATKGGNVPPNPQFSLKLTKHVEAWAKQSAGKDPTWTFKVLGDPSVGLQSGTDFKVSDQFSVNILHLIWNSHLLPATELSLQANGALFLDKQIGAQIELEQPLMGEVSLIVDGTFNYGRGANEGMTNYAITAGLEFKILQFGKKK